MTLAQILPPGGASSLTVMSSSTRASGASDTAARGDTGDGFADRLRQVDAARGTTPAAGEPGNAAVTDTTVAPPATDGAVTAADGTTRDARPGHDRPVADDRETSPASGVTSGVASDERTSATDTESPAADAGASTPTDASGLARPASGDVVDLETTGMWTAGVPVVDGGRPGDSTDGNPTAFDPAADERAVGGSAGEGLSAGRPVTGDPASTVSSTVDPATGAPVIVASTNRPSSTDAPASAAGAAVAGAPVAGTPAAGAPGAGHPDAGSPTRDGRMVGLAPPARPDVPLSGQATSSRGSSAIATAGESGEPAVTDGRAPLASTGVAGSAGQRAGQDALAAAGRPGTSADTPGGSAGGRVVGQGVPGSGTAAGSVPHAPVGADMATAAVAGAERAVASVPAAAVVTAGANPVDGRSSGPAQHAGAGDTASVATPTPGGGTRAPGSPATVTAANGLPLAGADTAAVTGRPESGTPVPVALPAGMTVARSPNPDRAVRSRPDGSVDGGPAMTFARPTNARPDATPPASPVVDTTVMAARLVEARNRHADRVATTVVDDALRLATAGRRVERPGVSPLFGASATSFDVAGLALPGPLDARATTLPGTPLGHLAGPSLVSRVDIAPLPIAPHSVPLDGSSNGAGELAAGIRWTLGEGRGHALVNVTPAGLGPVNIRVSVEPDHVSVSIVAAQLGAREALESLIPRLREQLAADGHDKVQVDVSGGHQDRAGSGTSSRHDGQDGTGTGRATTENAATRDAERLTRTAAPRLDLHPTALPQGRSLIDAWA